MKRIPILAAAMLAAALLSPAGEGDIGDLIPVELLYVYIEEGDVWVETDSGQWGSGQSLDAALDDLRRSAPGEVFLETADHLILTEEARVLLPELTQVLRPAVQACLGDWVDDKTAAFLAAHDPGVTLNDIRAGEERLPRLIFSEGRYRIEPE